MIRKSTILQPKYNNAENNCNNYLLVNSSEEIVQQYEYPLKAMVHRSLEVCTKRAMEQEKPLK